MTDTENLGNACPAPDFNKPEVQNDLDKIADKMGMSNTCKRHMKNVAKEGVTTAEAELKMGMFGPSAKAKATNTWTAAEDSKSEEGCGQAILNVMQQHTSIQNISCTLRQNKSSQTVNINTNASISINTTQCEKDSLLQITREGHKAAFMADARTSIAAAKDQQTRLFLQKLNTEYLDHHSLISGSIQMKNVQINNAITGVYTISKNMSDQMKDELERDIQHIARAQAENNVKNTMGVNAVAPNTKQIIDSKISHESQDIKRNISQVIDSLDIKADTSGNIEIMSCAGIKLEDVVIDQHIMATVATKQLADIGSEIGNRMALEVQSETDAKAKNETDVKGQAAMKKAQMDGVKDILKAAGLNEPGFGSMLISGIVLVVVLLIVMNFMTSGSMPMPQMQPKPLTPMPPRPMQPMQQKPMRPMQPMQPMQSMQPMQPMQPMQQKPMQPMQMQPRPM